MSGPEGVVALALVATVGVTAITLARAIATRIARGGSGTGVQQEVADLGREVDQLRAELDAMHARLGEMDDLQNRVDFAERMLAQVREKNALPGAH